MDLLIAAALGSLLGLVTGLIPGLHVNTLASIGLAATAVPWLGVGLLAAGIVHTIVNIVPSTYMGVPDDDDVLVALPAHQMMLAGDGRSAVRASVAASVAAVLACILIAPIYAGWLNRGGLNWADQMVVPLLAGVIVLLVIQELKGWAVVVLGSSGLFGFIAPTVSSDYLLPMLAGLFGAAGMVMSLRSPPEVPWQRPARDKRTPPALIGGITVAGLTAVMPGLTSAVAASVLPRQPSPRRAITVLSAINTAHAILAILVVLASGRVRTGLADVVQQTETTAVWSVSGPTTLAIQLLQVMLAAAIIGGIGTLLVDRLVAPRIHAVPMRTLSLAGLLTLIVIVFALTGARGLAVFTTGLVIGIIPLKAGVRRVNLVGCLILPTLVARWP